MLAQGDALGNRLSPISEALKGRDTSRASVVSPFRADRFDRVPVPMALPALPWAGVLRPFRPASRNSPKNQEFSTVDLEPPPHPYPLHAWGSAAKGLLPAVLAQIKPA